MPRRLPVTPSDLGDCYNKSTSEVECDLGEMIVYKEERDS
jgi:hypothetical protein